MVDVSATMIRNLNKSEKQIEEFTPEAVSDYIKSKQLYRK
jgi:nicotinic acid mononucleotide adenylyltransferase